MPEEWRGLAPGPDPADETQAKGLALIRPRMNDGFKVRPEIRLHCSTRFLAKVALGLGFKLLGEVFISTPYGQELQRAFRESKAQKRATLKVQRTGFLHAVRDGASQLLRWDGAWVLLLKAATDVLSLTICSPSGYVMRIVISDEPSLWSESRLEVYREGQLFLIVPPRDEFLGPIPLPEYLAHRSGIGRRADLGRLEQLRIDPNVLPDMKLLPPQ
jgi:hypothetical protein